MKNLKLLLVLFVVLFAFQACNNDDEAKEADIVGVWAVSELVFDITINGESLSEYFGEDEADLFEPFFTEAFEDEFEDVSIEFKSDGTYLSEDSDGSTDTGTWSLNSNGDILILDDGTADEFTFNIVSSTNNTLVLNYSETDDSDIDFDGNPDEFTVSMDLTLTK
jgi:hypothetical protein